MWILVCVQLQVRELSVPFSQLCCKLETAFTNKVLKEKKPPKSNLRETTVLLPVGGG